MRIPILDFPVKIDIGCGQFPHPDKSFVGIDYLDYGQKIVWDITKGIPLPDNSCEYIYTSHCMEHLTPDQYHAVINDIARIAMNNCVFEFIVPHGNTDEGRYHCHYILFDEGHMRALDKGWPKDGNITFNILEQPRQEGIHLKCKFVINKR